MTKPPYSEGDHDIAGETRSEGATIALRQEFFGWQCRLRQHAMRHGGGRPAVGTRPQAYGPAANTSFGRITVLINKAESQSFAQQFRHMVLKTQEPNERYDSALNYFAAAYYQRGHEFDDRLSALFGPKSSLAEQLHAAKTVQLVFEQFDQRYRLDCRVQELAEHDPHFQVTYWHNRLFNPAMPAGVRVLSFLPDWYTAVSERIRD